MVEWLKSLYAPIPAEVLAAKMLAAHRVQLLEALQAESYAKAVAAHHAECIKRLESGE